MSRKLNFYAGPSVLPVSVLERIQTEMVEYGDTGLSLIETSHRSTEYDAVHSGARSLIKELFRVPDNYKILFLGGGATMQFSMVPMNLMGADGFCEFTLSGEWAKKAASDAEKLGRVNVIFDGKESGYSTLPDPGSLSVDDNAAYVHITSNETIGGLQWKEFPKTGTVPLVADMSSDILSRSVRVEDFGLIYAGAQKNLGPAGVTLVIIREDLLLRSSSTLTAYLNYQTHAKKDSLYNTPPVFSIYAVKLVLEDLKAKGGVAAIEALNKKKASLIYQTIDQSGGFYSCPVEKPFRSNMNVVFRLKSEELEKDFLKGTVEANMVGLKGHRAVGGCRASIYNSMPIEGVETLAEYMKDYARKKG